MIKDSFNKLVYACKEDDDMLDIIESDIKSLGEYVHTVYMMEASLTVLRSRFEGQDLRDRIASLDQNRRLSHERAIMGVKRLNRFAEMEGLEPVFGGNVDDRYQIADFCKAAVDELFDGRIGKSFSIDEYYQHSEDLYIDDEEERG